VGKVIISSGFDCLYPRVIASSNRGCCAIDIRITDNKGNLTVSAVANNNGSTVVTPSDRNTGVDVILVDEGVGGLEITGGGNINISTTAITQTLGVNLADFYIATGVESNITAIIKIKCGDFT